MGRISRYTITANISSLRLDGGSRIVLKTDADFDIAYDIGDFDNDNYFTIGANEVFVFDPNPLTGEVDSLDTLFYVRALGGNATVQVWVQSAKYQR